MLQSPEPRYQDPRFGQPSHPATTRSPEHPSPGVDLLATDVTSSALSYRPISGRTGRWFSAHPLVPDGTDASRDFESSRDVRLPEALVSQRRSLRVAGLKTSATYRVADISWSMERFPRR